MGLRRLTEEELMRLSKQRPETAAYLRKHRAEAEQRAKQKAATADTATSGRYSWNPDDEMCAGPDCGHESGYPESPPQETVCGGYTDRYSATPQQPSQQAARLATDTEPDTQPPETPNTATGLQ